MEKALGEMRAQGSPALLQASEDQGLTGPTQLCGSHRKIRRGVSQGVLQFPPRLTLLHFEIAFTH